MNRATFAQQGRVVRPDSAHTDSARLRAAITLPAVEVRASIAPIAAPIVGSGIPASIANVPGREMSAWKPRLLPDALASQPGVSLYDDLGTPWKINLSSRGFAVGPTVGLPPGISVFLDGVRQNEPDAQEVNFDLLPIDHIRRVELLNGAASLLGANSLGGAINLVTPRGAGPFSGEVETSAGSFRARSVSADLGGGASEWNYYMSGGAGQERGWRAATGDSRYDGFLNVGHDGARRGLPSSGVRSQIAR
jgi:outer membrane cobalamin receptor